MPLLSSRANDVTLKCFTVMHITRVSRQNQFSSDHSLNHHSVLSCLRYSLPFRTLPLILVLYHDMITVCFCILCVDACVVCMWVQFGISEERLLMLFIIGNITRLYVFVQVHVSMFVCVSVLARNSIE